MDFAAMPRSRAVHLCGRIESGYTGICTPKILPMFNSFWHDFKAFAIKGNMIDLAVGVVIGAAFNGMLNAIVTGLISPPLGYLTGGIDLGDKSWTVIKPTLDATGALVEGTGLVLQYGLVLENAVDFFIMALTLFLVVRFMKRVRDKAEDPSDKSVPTPKDLELLAEIRDGIRALSPAIAAAPSAAGVAAAAAAVIAAEQAVQSPTS